MVTIAVLMVIFLSQTLWNVKETPLDPKERRPLGEVMASSFDIRSREYPDFFQLLYSRFMINLGFYTALEFLPKYFQDSLGLGKVQGENAMATLTIIFIVGSLISTFPAGVLADRASKKLVVYITCGLSIVATIVFCLLRSLPLVYGTGFVFGLAYGAFCAVDWAFACNLLPEESAAKYMGIWHFCATVPQVLAPAFGPLADRLNSHYGMGTGWRGALFTVAIYTVIGTWLIRKVREKVQPGAALLGK